MHKLVSGFMLAALLAALLPGCDKTEKEETALATIKVAFDNEGSFLGQYGELFIAKHPEIEIEVVSLYEQFAAGKNTEQAFEAVMRQAPDVLALNMDQYTKYAAEGRLYDLSPLIARDHFDLDKLAPAVIRLLNASGGGGLFGLGPAFSTSMLYYNKDLFDRIGASYPNDQMSWNDILQLAQRFADNGEEKRRVYGIQMRDTAPFYLATEIGRTQGLALYDPVNGKITADTSAWRDIFRTVVLAYSPKASYIYRPPLQPGGSLADGFSTDAFINGRVAMQIRGFDLMDELQKAKQLYGIETPNWDVAMPPVNPRDPEVNAGLDMQRIFAISSQSPRLDEAWELLKYIHGDEYARIRSRSEKNVLLTRMGYSGSSFGRDLDKFYNSKPPNSAATTDPNQMASILSFVKLAKEEVEAAVNGSKTVEESLQTIQLQGQQMWDQAQ
ncbi:extracellular solute-binding protein [Paenibacillus ginsengarvi]|uniref:extracellular solute-binding protein n=1 Tax=Paenibacillus ginsengarvi TaxID=400777 RepID=UPI0011C3BB61|nr:extracellular solute-binding protein [Paenibacillus ginsengarvi]